MEWTQKRWDKARQEMLDREGNRRRMTEALLDWCSLRTWGVFYTQTFKRQASSATVAAASLRFLAGTLFRSGVTAALWAVEPHADNHRHHAHMLLSLNSTGQSMIYSQLQLDLSPQPRLCTGSWRTWYQHIKREAQSMGHARLYPVLSSKSGLVSYVTKYVCKGLSAKTTLRYPKKSSPNCSTAALPRIVRSEDVDWGFWTWRDVLKSQRTPEDDQEVLASECESL